MQSGSKAHKNSGAVFSKGQCFHHFINSIDNSIISDNAHFQKPRNLPKRDFSLFESFDMLYQVLIYCFVLYDFILGKPNHMLLLLNMH